MRIAVLGPLEVLTDDLVPLPVPGAKERLLLAALAAGSPGVVSTDSLAETLWNGDPPASAHKSLQAHVVRLRSSLEPGRQRGSTGRYVLRRGAGYALAVDRGAIDAVRMRDLATRGRAQLASGRPEEAAEQLRLAVELWRGEPYADWPEAPFAESERRRLAEVRAGAEAGLLEAQLELGRHADVVPELERLVAQEPLREDWWRLLLLALYRAGRQGDALAAGRRARALLAEELGAEPGPALRQMEAAILAHDPALEQTPGRAPPQPVSDAAPSAQGSCPYKGLASYQAADAPLFHGRRRLVASLVARLVDASVLVVSGSSGAGKSSAVRAGLVPAVAGGALPGSGAWQPVILTPGRTPVDALASLTGDSPPADPVLLVCDQFEELWAPGVDPAERVAFLDAVLGLIDDGIVVRCVAVVRGDHVGRLAEHAAFTERLGGALVLVPGLTDDELREVVREPAAAAGLTADPELVEAVVADVLGRPAALPLLSTALVGTWERRRGDTLTLAGYLEAGGVAGALTRSAEGAYSALDEPGRELARRLLVRLADVDDGGALVRRPVPLAELDLDGEGGAARREVVEAFVNRRLLSLDGDRLEVAHEALLTGWPRLARWLEDDAAGRIVRRQLAPSARAWSDGGRPDEELYRGARLAAALDWAAGADADMTPTERQFLDGSKARADAELNDARDRAHREAAGRRRTRRLAIGLAVVLVVALVAAGLAVLSRREAQRASLVADANRLAALSTSVGSLDLSYLLAAEAYRLADTPQTQDGLLATLAEHRRVTRAVPFPNRVLGAALANGTLFIGGATRLLSWTPTSGELPHEIRDLMQDEWARSWGPSVASPTDGVWALAGFDGDDAWIGLVDAEGGVRLLEGADALGGAPMAVSYTPDGRLLNILVVPFADGEPASSWHMVTLDPAGGPPRETGVAGTLPAPLQEVGMAISDDGGTAVLHTDDRNRPTTLVDLATGRETKLTAARREAALHDFRALPAGMAELWDDGTVTHVRPGGVVEELHAHTAPVNDVALAPDGTWAATVDEAGHVEIWDVDPGSGRWTQRESLEGHSGAVVEAGIDATSTELFTVATDDTVIVWDLTPDGGFGTSHVGLPDRWLANRPEVVDPGKVVVAPTRPLNPAGEEIPYLDESTRSVAATFLDPLTGAVVDEVPIGHTPDVNGVYFGASVAVSPDRRWVAVTSGLATTVLDARTHDEVTDPIVLPATGYPRSDGTALPVGVAWSAAWTPDSSRLLIGTDDVPGEPFTGEIVAVDTATWRVEDRVEIPVVPEVMAMDDGDRWLAVSGDEGSSLVFLDPSTLDIRHEVELRGNDRVTAMSFSDDGRYLAAGGESGAVHIADTRTWTAREPVLMRNEWLLQLEWLPDDRTVVSTGAAGSISMYDVERGVVRAGGLPASVHGKPGYAGVMPEPDDEIVALNDEQPGLRYPMDPAVWLEEVCDVAGRDLTRAEWDRYLPGREYEPTCSDLD